jgi:hypothetical protein
MPRAANQRESARWASTGLTAQRKLAVTIGEAAEVLGIPEPMVERLACGVRPYQHADGTPRWPLRELARALADCGGIVPPDGWP